jgi:hypothetical protein
MNGNDAIHAACSNSQVEIARMLLADSRVDPSSLCNMCICIASDRGFLDIVKMLLNDARVDPSSGDNYSIRFASGHGHAEVVKLLLDDTRVVLSADDKFAIRLAIEDADPKSARILAAHTRWGIHAYPELYAKHHPELTAEYERVRGQCRAVTWVMQGLRWEGVAQCVVERLQGFLLY